MAVFISPAAAIFRWRKARSGSPSWLALMSRSSLATQLLQQHGPGYAKDCAPEDAVNGDGGGVHLTRDAEFGLEASITEEVRDGLLVGFDDVLVRAGEQLAQRGVEVYGFTLTVVVTAPGLV